MNKILFLLVFFAFFIYPQTNYWTQTNLTSGRFDAIIVNDNGYVFAGGEGRGIVYRSKDLGYSWTQVALPQAFAVLSFEVNSGGHVFVGTDIGIFFSSDNGEKWHNIGLQTFNVSAILFSNGILYAGTRGNGVYQTSDTGKTWLQAGPFEFRYFEY